MTPRIEIITPQYVENARRRREIERRRHMTRLTNRKRALR